LHYFVILNECGVFKFSFAYGKRIFKIPHSEGGNASSFVPTVNVLNKASVEGCSRRMLGDSDWPATSHAIGNRVINIALTRQTRTYSPDTHLADKRFCSNSSGRDTFPSNARVFHAV